VLPYNAVCELWMAVVGRCRLDKTTRCQNTIMQSADHKQLRRKRETYRRSQTLTALPASLSLHPHSISQQQQQGTESAPVAGPSQSQPVLFRSSSRTSGSSVSSTSAVEPHNTPPPQQPTASQRRAVLGRTPSSSSVLLSRMRELIREKVVETTVNRSDLAALERERRQRAADAFVESLRRHQQQQQHRHSSGSVDVSTPPGLALSSSLRRRMGTCRHRTRSDPASSQLRLCSPGLEALPGEIPLQSMAGSSAVAKSAFREYRSTSEDTSSRSQRTTTRRLSHDVAIGHRSKGYSYTTSTFY